MVELIEASFLWVNGLPHCIGGDAWLYFLAFSLSSCVSCLLIQHAHTFWGLKVQRGEGKRAEGFPIQIRQLEDQKRLKAEREVFAGLHFSSPGLEKPLTQDFSAPAQLTFSVTQLFLGLSCVFCDLYQVSAAPTIITAHLPQPKISVTLLKSTCQPKSPHLRWSGLWLSACQYVLTSSFCTELCLGCGFRLNSR